MQLLEQIFGKKNNIRVLRHLARHMDWEFNITELSKDIKINKGILSRLVNQLEKDNLVKINRKGKIILFKLNKENLIIKELVIPSFKSEREFIDLHIKPRLLKIKSKDIISVVMYGSYAIGNFKLTSDIDLMVVVKNKNSNVEKNFEALKKTFLEEDIVINIDIIPLKEFKKLYKMKEPLIGSIEKDHVIISGKRIQELIN